MSAIGILFRLLLIIFTIWAGVRILVYYGIIGG